jgi:hypothetical protein
MMDQETTQSPPPAFRFLNSDEFAALTQDERIQYLRDALEAIKIGVPLDDMPTTGEQL